MGNLSDDIKRKIRIRRFAMDNADQGAPDEIVGSSHGIDNNHHLGDEIESLYSQLYWNIEKADQCKIQTGYSIIRSDRKLGKLIVFIKRFIRKAIHVFLGWYIKPILDKQTDYNGKAINAVNLLRQITSLQKQRIDELTRIIHDLEDKISNIKNSDIHDLNNKISNLEFGVIGDLKSKISNLESGAINDLSLLRQITSLQKQRIDELTRIIHDLEDKISNIKNSDIHDLDNKITNLENGVIGDLKSKISNLESGAINDLKLKMDYALDRLNVTCDINLLKNNQMDYFKFEDTFRGKRENVKEIQRAYVPYFRGVDGIILDIGCGRGEFLELMYENGIPAYGIDIYDGFIDYCRERGFNVEKSDALTYLNKLQNCSLGGIFMSQVIEHLPNDYILALVRTAYQKLKPGCYFIVETPNPGCLAALSEFNIDLSHIRPIHYKTLEFILKESHFSSVERYHAEQTLYPVSAKHIQGSGIDNADEFNQGIDFINNLLFSYRDYTIVAKK